MALKLDYVARETATNLVRNVTLTLATVLTVVVSLTLFGSALLLQEGAQNANERFQRWHRVHRLPAARTSPTSRSRRSRPTSRRAPTCEDFTYVDQDESYEEFKRLFADTPQLVEIVTPEILPPSFKVVPTITDPEVVQAVGDQFVAKPGVREVIFAFDVIKASGEDVQQDRRPLPHRRRHAACRRPPAHPQHHPGGHVRPTARDRGDEARRRHELVHPHPVHHRGDDPDSGGRIDRDRIAHLRDPTRSSTSCRRRV